MASCQAPCCQGPAGSDPDAANPLAGIEGVACFPSWAFSRVSGRCQDTNSLMSLLRPFLLVPFLSLSDPIRWPRAATLSSAVSLIPPAPILPSPAGRCSNLRPPWRSLTREQRWQNWVLLAKAEPKQREQDRLCSLPPPPAGGPRKSLGARVARPQWGPRQGTGSGCVPRADARQDSLVTGRGCETRTPTSERPADLFTALPLQGTLRSLPREQLTEGTPV